MYHFVRVFSDPCFLSPPLGSFRGPSSLSPSLSPPVLRPCNSHGHPWDAFPSRGFTLPTLSLSPQLNCLAPRAGTSETRRWSVCEPVPCVGGPAGKASHTRVSGNTAVQRGDYDYLWGRGEGNEILALGPKLKGLLEKKKTATKNPLVLADVSCPRSVVVEPGYRPRFQGPNLLLHS